MLHQLLEQVVLKNNLIQDELCAMATKETKETVCSDIFMDRTAVATVRQII